VAGLVAITPSCASVNVVGALIIGAVAGVACAFAVGLKYRFGLDDSLDVVGVHLVGGFVGTVLVGFLAAPATAAIAGGAGVSPGLFYGGGTQQLWRQIIGAGSVAAYSAVGTAAVAWIVKYTIGLRLGAEAEASGIDEALHAESGYDFAVGGSPGPVHSAEERSEYEADYRDREALHAGGHQDRLGTGGAAGHNGQ
jgi:Amt family ammonium transporter